MNLAALPLWELIALFAGAAAVVWFAGSGLTGKVDAIATKTGMGQAFAGMLLLGGITSLPEVAAVSAQAVGVNGQLAVNNLLGTASINVLLLALADVVYGQEALTGVAAEPAVLMQGVLERRDKTVLRMGYDSLAVLATFALGVALLARLA
jgi:cation:H+ antiporter